MDRVFIFYMLIGYVVSAFFIDYYRTSGRTTPKTYDAYLGMIGPFIWPLQIVYHLKFLKCEEKLLAWSKSVLIKCEVIMLPTDKSRLYIYPIDGRLYYNFCKEDVDINRVGGEIGKPQHLYIISDNEIKEGDWVYWSGVGEQPKISKINGDCKFVNDSKYYHKVEATTDLSLNKELDSGLFDVSLPKISESFLKVYVGVQGKIKKVDVEFDSATNKVPNGKTIYWIKTNPDNTIKIHSYEDGQ